MQKNFCTKASFVNSDYNVDMTKKNPVMQLNGTSC